MFDRQDENDALFFVDPVDDAEIAPGCGVASLKFKPKGMADPMRIIIERSIDELDRGTRCRCGRDAAGVFAVHSSTRVAARNVLGLHPSYRGSKFKS